MKKEEEGGTEATACHCVFPKPSLPQNAVISHVYKVYRSVANNFTSLAFFLVAPSFMHSEILSQKSVNRFQCIYMPYPLQVVN